MKLVKILTATSVIAVSGFAFADETTPPPAAHHNKGAMFKNYRKLGAHRRSANGAS